MNGKYILDENGDPVPEPDLFVWYGWLEQHHRTRTLARTWLHGASVTVSTIFLGVDHNLTGEGPPVLWETMVFGGLQNLYQRRYTSRLDAIIGHNETVDLVLREKGKS